MNVPTNRRQFTVGAGVFTLAIALPGVKPRAGVLASRVPLKPDQLATYISINADGTAVGWIGKVDMGQGTDIGWIQMIAEELDMAAEQVSVVQGHTNLTFNMGGASGSTRTRGRPRTIRCAAPRPSAFFSSKSRRGASKRRCLPVDSVAEDGPSPGTSPVCLSLLIP